MNYDYHLRTDEIRVAVGRLEFVNDKLSFMIWWGWWCDIVINVRALIADVFSKCAVCDFTHLKDFNINLLLTQSRTGTIKIKKFFRSLNMYSHWFKSYRIYVCNIGRTPLLKVSRDIPYYTKLKMWTY